MADNMKIGRALVDNMDALVKTREAYSRLRRTEHIFRDVQVALGHLANSSPLLAAIKTVRDRHRRDGGVE